MSDRILLVGGNPRSGTTALNRILNANPRVYIGRERFLGVFNRGQLTRAHFEEGRFFDMRGGDTHPVVRGQFEEDPEGLRAKFRAAEIIGDKIPPIYRGYDVLWKRFPKARVLYIVRNPLSVAESYQARFDNEDDSWQKNFESAIEDWNESVTRTLEAIQKGRDIVVVTYERLFQSEENFDKLFAALGVERSDEDRALVAESVKKFTRLAERPTRRREMVRYFVAMNGAFEPYREIVNAHCILRDETTKTRSPQRVNQSKPRFGAALLRKLTVQSTQASAERGFRK